MYILGIAGRGHDASVCLVKDGELMRAMALERFCRLKRAVGPSHIIQKAALDAVHHCLESEGIGWDDLEHIVAVSPDTCSDADEELLGPTLMIGADAGRFLPMPHPSHHLAHAYASFYTSGFSEAAALIIDGYGSFMDGGKTREAESGYYFKRGAEPRTIFKNKKSPRIAGMQDRLGDWTVPDSIEGIGETYRIVTLLLGFFQDGVIYDEPGKTMGLASYGTPLHKPARMLKNTATGVDYSGAFEYLMSLNMIRRRGDSVNELMVRTPQTPLSQFHCDLAAQVQYEFEEACIHLARLLQRETGCDKLVLGGGCALNSVANTRILEESGFKEISIFPAATDDGTSVGAAYYGYEFACRKRGKTAKAPPMRHAYLGPSYTDEACLQAIRAAGLAYEDCGSPEGAGRRAGQLLAEGQIIGWFQGGAEFGPRALGHRSILADPRGDTIKDTLNRRVKFREAFRPFAPAVLAEAAAKYFHVPCPESPFMLMVCDVREEYRALLPGITHVDGTARHQTVDREVDPAFARVIESFAKITGLPIVLNTSFNLKGEPIVETPADALRCFTSTEMDSLVLGRYVASAWDFGSKVPRRCAMRLRLDATLDAGDTDLRPAALQLSSDGSSEAMSWEPEVLPLLLRIDGKRNVAAIAGEMDKRPEDLKPVLLALLRRRYIEWTKDE
jgi:carbamoyltransferase